MERDQAEVRPYPRGRVLGAPAGAARRDARNCGCATRSPTAMWATTSPCPASRPRIPLLRKYNLADREQNALELTLGPAAVGSLDVASAAELRDDDYSDSVLGLQSARQRLFNLDGSLVYCRRARCWVPRWATRTSAPGRPAARHSPRPTGRRSNDDDTRFAMLSLDLPAMLERWRLPPELHARRDRGRHRDQASPDSYRRSRTWKRACGASSCSSRYQLRERWAVLLRYAYEDYGVKDWSRDGVLPDTLPRVLALGAILAGLRGARLQPVGQLSAGPGPHQRSLSARSRSRRLIWPTSRPFSTTG